MFKSILVPIDMSDAEKGKAMINVATKTASQGTKIRLVSIIEDIPTFIAGELPSGVIDRKVNDVKEGLKAIAAASALKSVDTEVRSGSAATGILAAAEDWGADLIIIGSHKPGLQDYFLGSTASRVVRHAKCSVLVSR
jgi:nucleotide-binding universal stress UspA family protein